jgi:chemotaxis family two-component system sensor kinase Cph1
MNIKDIVNRDIVNLTNCEHEPIHIPGSIQPHGFLFAFRADRVIRFCSGNISEYTDTPLEQFLGATFSSLFGKEHDARLSEYLGSTLWQSGVPFGLEIRARHYTCTIHISEDLYVIEGEPRQENKFNALEIYSQTRRFTDYMEQSQTLRQLCQKVAGETREITGYDRVMIYRFDKDYNGEIFAESCADHLEPFLGLHYPHTDIPSQARALYLRNQLRLIVDLEYEPVPLYTIDDGKTVTLDMSLSTLRSVSPIHVQYLLNMGVSATLTISLIHKGRLWGLIACHHYSRKYITPETRLAAKLQGHFLTSQIDVRQSAEEYETAKIRNLAAEQMIARNPEVTYTSFEHITGDPALLTLADATGAAVLIRDTIYRAGLTPPDDELHALAAVIARDSRNEPFYTSALEESYPGITGRCDVAAGVLYHTLGRSGSDCIIWFRKETREEVKWAGDPSKAIEKDEKGLSPRKSFETWKEVIKCKSRPWERPELDAAARYAYALLEHVNMLHLAEEERKYREVAEELKESNAELENINWISTHDLQEPLRKIQMITSIMQEKESMPEPVLKSVKRINESANRMQTLLKDILSYTRFRNNDDGHDTIDITLLVTEVVQELHDDISDHDAQVTIGKLPEITGVPFLLKQLFLNLLRNALKFTSPERNPEISITSEYMETVPGEEQPFYRVSITDNGIGFDQQYAQSIFKIFTRLHNHDKYAGSGIGLALCKKIMQKHGGFISAEGQQNNGAVFHLYFPAR